MFHKKLLSPKHKAHLKRIARAGALARAAKYNKPPLERFMDAIRVDEKGCWIWTGNLSRGYGAFKVDGRRSPVKAIRWAYEHFNKTKIPSSKIFVCHKCDVRACVNPEHLFLGTTQDNMDDCRAKDRFVKGEGHPCSKLTEDNVREIRRRLRNSECAKQELASKFNVTLTTISRIYNRKGWKHIE